MAAQDFTTKITKSHEGLQLDDFVRFVFFVVPSGDLTS